MEISKALEYNQASKVKYAFIDGDTNVMKVSNDKEFHSSSRYPNDVSLRDVEYVIIEGSLFIRGTRIFHYHFTQLFDLVTIWGERSVYELKSDERNSELETPFEEMDIYIKKWWGKKKIRGIDFTGILDEFMGWYKLKKEEPFECAISNFKLLEK